MIETAKMSDRGQIIIPKNIREEVHANTDTLFAVSTIDEDTIVMKKLDTAPLVRKFQSLREKATKYSQDKVNEEVNAARKSRSRH